MKTIKPITLVLLLISSLSLFSQHAAGLKEINSIIVPLSTESTYLKSLNYLHNNDFFILSLDRSSGFIQAKKYIKINKVFSNKHGERLTLNFLITPINPENSKITLVVYKETKYVGVISGKNSSASIHYDEDNGISTDLIFYQQVLKELKESIQVENKE